MSLSSPGKKSTLLAGLALLIVFGAFATLLLKKRDILDFLGIGSGSSAACFDGLDDAIEISHSPTVQFDQGVTLACWVFLDEVVEATIVNKWKVGEEDCHLRVTSDGRVAFALFLPGTPSNVEVQSRTRLRPKKWLHVVATYDRSSMRVYVDGELQGQIKESRPVRTSGDALRIGAILRERLRRPIRGRIDDLAIFRRGISSDEVTFLMAGLLSKVKTELVGYFSFDEDRGQVLRDHSGHGNHGRLGNSLVEDAADPTFASGRG